MPSRGLRTMWIYIRVSTQADVQWLRRFQEPKATVCFFLCFSLHGWEKSTRERDKKKHKTSKKKKKKHHQPAPPCDDSASWMSSWSITKPTLHCLASRCCTSLRPIYRSISRRMWRKKASRSSANLYSSYYLRQSKGLGPAPLQFLLATKGKGKRKPRSVWRTAPSVAQMPRCSEHFCGFFSCFFFSRVRKNQWARVTRNKEETRRGLTACMTSVTRPWYWCKRDSRESSPIFSWATHAVRRHVQ